MFASHLVPRSCNTYMLSTPSFKRGAYTGFEHLSTAPVPLVPQGRASRPVFHRTLVPCVLRHTCGGTRQLFTELLQLKIFSRNFKLFFDKFLLSKMNENQHGDLFRLSCVFFHGTSWPCHEFVARSARPCLGLSAVLSWCCRIVLYIYVENSSLGLKTV